jgi:hypothetical protein
MDKRAQVACAWAGFLGISLTLVALITADLLPPPAANDSAQEIAQWYQHNTDRIRTGAVLGVLSTAGWGALTAVAWLQLKKPAPVLAALQAISGAVTYVALILTFTVLGVASFRPDRPPETTQALHDLAWFCLVFTVVAPATQAITAGLAVLADPDAQFPRWLGYLGCWAGVLFVPGILLVYFKDGIFAYQGVIPYWIPLGAFGAWVIGLSWGCRRTALTGQD